MAAVDIVPEPRRLPVLTVSEMRAFRACPRKHALSYRSLVRPKESAGALRFGTLIHEALESWWLAAKDGADRLEAAISTVLASDAEQVDRIRAAALLTGYERAWSTAGLTVLAVEQPWEMPIVSPQTNQRSRTFALGGKIDAIVRDHEGLVWLVEHKTAKGDITSGSLYWQKLRLDTQVSVYLEAARALGYEPAGCIYDVIGKPGLEPLAATPIEARKYTKPTKTEPSRLYAGQRAENETLDEFESRYQDYVAENIDKLFVRGRVVRLPEEAKEAAWDTWQLARSIRDAELEERWPRNPDACVSFGRTCEFMPICTGETTADDETRYRRATSRHEELES